MARGWGKSGLPLLVGAVLALGGCGGSGSSSAERTKLANQVSPGSSGIPPDLSTCVRQQAHGLPIAQLRAAAKASSTMHPTPIEVGLVSSCVRQGKGVSGFRSQLLQTFERNLPATFPPVFRKCLEAKVNATTPGQVSQLYAFAIEHPAASESEGKQFVIGLGKQCAGEPDVVAALRTLFLTTVRHELETAHYSAAFRDCNLKKYERFPTSALQQGALSSASVQSFAYTFGRNAAKACIASGARP